MNWKQRIDRAMKHGGHFTNKDEELSSYFNRCAVGEKFPQLRKTRHLDQSAENITKLTNSDQAFHLGVMFHRAISDDDTIEALLIYEAIQLL